MSWLGFNTAVSGLMGSQKKIHVANHNVASAEREGYSKQATYERSNTALRLPGVGYMGTGNNIYDIRRVRDAYVDFKYRKENSPAGEWQVKRQSLTELEGILKGTREHGINVSIDEFFSSLEDLSTNPSDNSYKMSFRQKAEALAVRLNETAQSFNRKQAGLNIEVGAKIKEVNDITTQIANINGQIFRMEIDGRHANDLRDQRDLLVDKLSKIVDIDTSEDNNKFTVKVGGTTMVDHDYTKQFKYPPRTEKSKIDEKQFMYQLEWEDEDPVILHSGELKGLIESRDGNGVDPAFKGVPYYVERLDEFARGFAKKVNEVFEKGNNDPSNPGKKNIKLFTKDGVTSGSFANYSELKAGNIKLSGEVLSSLDYIMTSETGLPEDNKLVKEIIDLRDNKTFFVKGIGTPPVPAYSGTPEDFLTSIISTLGTDSQYSDRMDKNQSAIMDNIENQRLSISGVDLNEEMNNVVRFQQLYSASARMITVFDEIFQKTINNLGIVGR